MISVELSGNRGRGKHALIDDADFHLVGHLTWYLDSTGYVATNAPRSAPGPRKLYLHRILLDLSPGDGIQVDHRNRDPLDNRRRNLRPCSHAENAQNQSSINANGLPRGVSRTRDGKKWRARVRITGQERHLGTFLTPDAAASVVREFRAAHLPFAVEDEVSA